MKSFIEMSLPREMEAETESEKQIAALKECLSWFYRRGVQVTIKPKGDGFSLTLAHPQIVIVDNRS